MPAPQQIGKYHIVGVAGQGNMGTVYVGHDPFSDANVAIKVCSVTAGSGFKIARKLFFNEAHTAGGLDHPNILSVLDAGEQDGQPYIVMEYVDGGDTLRSHVTPETLLPLPRVIEVLYQCAKALDYAHRRGVIHRDIKPSNIMLTADGVVKIGDFGIAQHALSDETQLLGILGSPRYMSPEQVREEDLTHQSDLFSLGVVAYELVTGKPAFVGRSMAQLVRRIVNDEPAPVAGLRPQAPPGLAAIITKAMAKQLQSRYEYAHEMAADLASLFGSMDHSAPPPSAQERFNALRPLAFFNEFSDSELGEVLAAGSWREVRPGATVIAENEPGTAFYLLVNGEASAQLDGVEVGLLLEGECFGEMAVLTQELRGASVVATEACTLLRIDGPQIERATMGCQLRLNQVFLRTLLRRLARTNARLAKALGADPRATDDITREC
jgi:serine/threonine protein kinase